MRLRLAGADERPVAVWAGWGKLVVGVARERALWLSLAVGLVAIALAYQTPRPLLVDVGGIQDEPHMVGFHEPEQNAQANYRWSTASSAIVFQSMGKPLSPFAVHLQLSSGPTPMDVQVSVNGHAVPPLHLVPQSSGYTVGVDPTWIDATGDLRLDFTSPTFKQGKDRRELGFLADFARVDRPAGIVLPSLTQLLGLLLSGALLYLLLRSVWLVPRAAGVVTSLFLLACAGVIAFQRLLLTIYTDRLLFTLVIALLVAVVAEVLTRWLVRAAGWRGAARLPEWSWAVLRGLIAVSVVLKVGGLLYPLIYIVDAPFHLKYITLANEVFFNGRSWDQYFGESLAFAVMPKEEWGSARAFIPYSPFFYVVSTPLAWLPLPLTLTVPVASAVFESAKVAIAFVVGLALGRRATGERTRQTARRAATVAAAAAGIYAFIPATFLLQQFGNWPTLLSIWLVAAWVAITALFWERITRPAPFVASTLLLTLTLLSYTVTAVYTGVFVVAMVAIGCLLAARDRRRWLAVLLSLVVASILSLIIYYGQYVPRILSDTLPTFGNAAQTQGSLTTLHPDWSEFFTGHLGPAFNSYDLALPYVLGFAGVLYFYLARGGASRQPQGQREHVAGARRAYALVAGATSRLPSRVASLPWQRIWTGAWLLIFPLFTLADYYIDQAFKEFWYALPAVAMLSALWLLALARRGTPNRLNNALTWLLVTALAWQSLSLWVFRLLFHSR